MKGSKCSACNRDPKRMNSDIAECSHPNCPHRRKAWSEQPKPVFKGPWPPNVSEDPKPLDESLK